MLKVVALLCLIQCCQAFFFNDPAWNGLQVTWGPNPFNSDYFYDLPRTTTHAENLGYHKLGDCDVNAKWRGQRYVKNGDYSVIVLYDVNGYIAGIQNSIPNNQADGYPKDVLKPPFIADENRYTISAYFVDPAIICTTGRSSVDFEAEGTGKNLYLQKTDIPEDSVKIAKKEGDLDTNEWTEGNCFATMGKHYWHNLTANMDCDQYFPVFLMYNGGKLNSFGWALNTDVKSPRYEHPTPITFQLFMKTVPQCLKDIPKVSTMHIYMTDNAALNLC